MSADVRERKLEKNFSLLDLDRDGYVDKSDLVGIVGKFCEAIGEDPHSSEVGAYREALDGLWQALDTDGNGRLTRDEYVSSMSAIADQPGRLEELIVPVHRAFYNVLDEDNDGQVSKEEFVKMYQNSGMTPAEINEAFERLDTNGSGSLSVDELTNATLQFYRSSDGDEPGNFINGFF